VLVSTDHFLAGRRLAAAIVLFSFARTRTLMAQAPAELSAFNAMMVSPVGALAPVARELALGVPASSWTAAYGGWRYDIDDGVHNNVGVTYERRLSPRVSLAATGAYLSLDCDCSVWLSGGLSATGVLWSGVRGGGARGLSAHAAVQAMLGGARFTGGTNANAFSATGSMDLGVGIPLIGSSRLAASVFPGFGYGRFASPDDNGNGTRPMLGAALSVSLGKGFSLDAGTQRIIIVDGPRQYGAGITWRSR
jgi:hypothetical protein